ncbi:hypothetical protein EYF80_026682 [Liparis tanakae]|uniref:Uncharacterized protein n=1 Tax=Liparis tanakae TaxID=230148 RepID=A0A4Z2HBD0_9TELE|nr:hypothetical protein EYF80_026682 [Liparis tanakae]
MENERERTRASCGIATGFIPTHFSHSEPHTAGKKGSDPTRCDSQGVKPKILALKRHYVTFPL